MGKQEGDMALHWKAAVLLEVVHGDQFNIMCYMAECS